MEVADRSPPSTAGATGIIPRAVSIVLSPLLVGDNVAGDIDVGDDAADDAADAAADDDVAASLLFTSGDRGSRSI